MYSFPGGAVKRRRWVPLGLHKVTMILIYISTPKKNPSSSKKIYGNLSQHLGSKIRVQPWNLEYDPSVTLELVDLKTKP